MLPSAAGTDDMPRPLPRGDGSGVLLESVTETLVRLVSQSGGNRGKYSTPAALLAQAASEDVHARPGEVIERDGAARDGQRQRLARSDEFRSAAPGPVLVGCQQRQPFNAAFWHQTWYALGEPVEDHSPIISTVVIGEAQGPCAVTQVNAPVSHLPHWPDTGCRTVLVGLVAQQRGELPDRATR